MASIKIDREACKGCSLCVKSCPKNVIAISDKSNSAGYFPATPVNMAACIGCTFCAVMCPDVCIEVER